MSQSKKKVLSLFSSIQFTSAGSSEVVGAESAGGGGESKQSVEHSIENEATAQLEEIGVDQLDKLEEPEEKTPKDVANNEGDVLEDEDFDEDDEGLLEHAINASLLNDDNREIFHANIARIEGTPSTRVIVE